MKASEQERFDLVVVGGGMVGASLACMLAAGNAKWRVALLEQHAINADQSGDSYQPSFDARSTALARGSIEIFQQLGWWNELQKHVTPIDSVHISDKGHIGGAEINARDYPNSAGGFAGVGAVVENAWLGKVLQRQLSNYANLTVLAPASVEKLQAKAGGYQLRVTMNGAIQEISTSLCLICDGAQSNLRAALGIASREVDYHQHAIIANVELSQSHKGVAYERFTDSGPMALLPLGESARANRAALVWTLPSADALALVDTGDDEFLQRLQKRFGYRLGRFTKVGVRHSYPLKLIIASEQIRAHLVLMGNAAHFLHPVAGQGFNLALRDCAALLDELLAAEKRGETLGALPVLQRYVARQSFDQQATIGFSHGITQLFSSSALPQAALRALGFIGLELLPPAKYGLAEQTMGTFGAGARLAL